VGEVREPERDPLDPLGKVVDSLGRPVRHVGAVPGQDLVLPFVDGSAEPLDLWRHRFIGESRQHSRSMTFAGYSQRTLPASLTLDYESPLGIDTNGRS